MNQVKDFTKGNIPKIILSFYFPMFFTNMLQQVYSFVDMAIVGKGLGDLALASVGNTGSLSFLIIGFSVGLANGFSVPLAQAFGGKDYAKLRKVLAAALVLAVSIGLFLTIVSIIGLKSAMVWLQTDASIMQNCLKYGYIVFGFLLVTLSYNMSACILRALGDSKTPLNAIIVSTVLNLVLDCLFIFGLRTGVEGAAIATVISQFVATMMCVKKITAIDFLRVTKEDIKSSAETYIDLLKNGIPMAFMNSVTAVGCMVVQYYVNGFGVNYTSAYSACSKYINLFMQPAFTAGHVMSAYTGQNYGAQEYERIKKGLFVCTGIAVVAYVILGSIMFIWATPLARILLTGETPIRYATEFLRITGVFLFAVDILFVFRSAVQGMGRPMIPMISGISEMIIRIITIVTLSQVIGFQATAYAEVFAWFGALIINAGAFVVIQSKHVMNQPNKQLSTMKV